MSALPRRTSRQDRRLVPVVLTIALITSTLAMLAIRTEFAGVLFVLAALFAIVAGTLAANRARVAPGRAFLAERVTLTPLIWIGLVAHTFDDYALPFGSSSSTGGLGVWLLGGTWAWAGLGAAAYCVKRLYEREGVRWRLARGRGSQVAAPWLVPIVTAAAALALVARLLIIGADPVFIAAGALFASTGALLVQRGFPRSVLSPLGRCLLLGGTFTLGAAVSTFGAVAVRPIVFLLSSAPEELQPRIGDWLSLAGSYALLGLWLLARPFADYRLGRHHFRDSR